MHLRGGLQRSTGAPYLLAGFHSSRFTPHCKINSFWIQTLSSNCIISLLLQSPSDQFDRPFDIYQPITLSPEQSGGSYSAPHTTRSHDHNPFHSTPNFNSQAAGLSIPSSQFVPQHPSIHPPDTFSQPQFDSTYLHVFGNGIYDDFAPGQSFTQTPLSVTPNNTLTEDIVDPPHSPHYLRSFSNPSPLSESNLNLFTTMSPSLHLAHDTASFLPPSSSPIFPSHNSTHHSHLSASTPGHSPTLYFEDSNFMSRYDLP